MKDEIIISFAQFCWQILSSSIISIAILSKSILIIALGYNIVADMQINYIKFHMISRFISWAVGLIKTSDAL